VKIPGVLRFLVICSFALILGSCGGGANNNGVLQSIVVTPSTATGSTQFTATGIYSNGKQVTPIAVSWFFLANSSDLDPAPFYSLVRGPYTGQCPASGSYLITAFAPQSPTAPNSGAMVASVWFELVTGQTRNLGGFVAGNAQLTCP